MDNHGDEKNKNGNGLESQNTIEPKIIDVDIEKEMKPQS